MLLYVHSIIMSYKSQHNTISSNIFYLTFLYDKFLVVVHHDNTVTELVLIRVVL